MLASELFAMSQGSKCVGQEECHWCTSKCSRLWQHDEPAPLYFTKNKSYAKRPGSNYICIGCWLWRRKRVTVFFLDGELKDGQEACNHSWLITKEEAKAINIKKPEDVYPVLLAPPKEFSLSFIEAKDQKNFLQMKVVNSYEVIKTETNLEFTIDNIVHSYNVYELQEALKHGGNGKEPGVQALLRLLGPWSNPEENGKEVKRGRPTIEDKLTPDKALRKIVTK
jgi:hypothetical protein